MSNEPRKAYRISHSTTTSPEPATIPEPGTAWPYGTTWRMPSAARPAPMSSGMGLLMARVMNAAAARGRRKRAAVEKLKVAA